MVRPLEQTLTKGDIYFIIKHVLGYHRDHRARKRVADISLMVGQLKYTFLNGFPMGRRQKKTY